MARTIHEVLLVSGRSVLLLAGVGLGSVGALGTVVGVLALIDPRGTQLSDDGNPLGQPAPAGLALLQVVAFVTVAALGVWMVARMRSGARRREQAERPAA